MQRTTHTTVACLKQVIEASFQRLLLRTHVQQIVDRLRALELPNIVSHHIARSMARHNLPRGPAWDTRHAAYLEATAEKRDDSCQLLDELGGLRRKEAQ